ncbi:MAG: hypothetical protein H0W50_03820 [Parachlamydiaceae bacterium]|nr:hypothetical protein [Parachlamydiaceae bacterium]
MSFNINRKLVCCFATIGIAAYYNSKKLNRFFISRNEVLVTKILSNQAVPIYPITLNRSIQDITNVTDSAENILQEKLKINFMYAHEAILHTNEVLPHGPLNYTDDLTGISVDLMSKMDSMRTEQDLIIRNTLQSHYNFDKINKVVADVAKKHKIGNCGEQAAVAYLYLKHEKKLRKIDKLCLVNGDHAFVVIGRDPLSDITKPLTWGKTAVVCDPWGKKYFPAEQLFDQLNKISEEILYIPTLHTIGWTSFGDIPPEVSIYQGLKFHQRVNKKLFAEKVITSLPEACTGREVMIKACLIDYIERKAKPKVPPLLSKIEQEKVELECERSRY